MLKKEQFFSSEQEKAAEVIARLDNRYCSYHSWPSPKRLGILEVRHPKGLHFACAECFEVFFRDWAEGTIFCLLTGEVIHQIHNKKLTKENR